MRQMLMPLIIIAVLFTATSVFAGDCGDVNNSGTINALDVTYLINFLYKCGPAPFCGLGDVNTSGSINALDITYLINYLYKQGPAPDCGSESGTVTDIDGNVYQTLRICNQWWMVENLKVTHYSNGDPIPNVTDNTEWSSLTTGAYCNHDNDEGNVVTYGRLYNWRAVDDSRNIAPVGWHVPSDDEWKQLEMHLGMSQAEADAISWRGTDEGGKMKETGTTHWQSPNTGATNESGFSALPGDYRSYSGAYFYIGYQAYFWSSTRSGSNGAWYRTLSYDRSGVFRILLYTHYGLSVRCVKD